MPRLNPYRIKTKEYTKFRGIGGPDEKHNMSDAQTSSLNNLESFKLRTLVSRSGSVRDDEFDVGSVHEGTSAITTRGICAGNAIYAETKIDTISNRPSKFPWRTIHFPAGGDPIGGLDLSIRCQELTVPDYASARAGYNEMIVNSSNFMDCFVVTCQDMWDSIGEIDGFTQNTNNASKEYSLTEAMLGNCYDENELPICPPDIPPGPGNTTDTPPPVITIPDPPLPPPVPPNPQPPVPPTPPIIPPNIIVIPPGVSNPFPPYVPPAPPPDGDDADPVIDPNPCKSQVTSVSFPSQSGITIVLAEGYTESINATLEMSASITDPSSWWSRIGVSGELRIGAWNELYMTNSESALGNPSSRAVLGIKEVINAGGHFSCSGTVNLTFSLKVLEGYVAGEHLEGYIRFFALDESIRIPVNIYICDEYEDIDVLGDVTYNQNEKDLLIGGSFPDTTGPAVTFGGMSLDHSTVIDDEQSAAISSTKINCIAGIMNVQFHKHFNYPESFTLTHTIPQFSGTSVGQTVKCKFVWNEMMYYNGIRIGTYKGPVPSLEPFCCGWAPESDSLALIDYPLAIIGSSSAYSKHIDNGEQLLTVGDDVTISFSIPDKTMVPTGSPVPSGSTESLKSVTVSGLKLMFLGLPDG